MNINTTEIKNVEVTENAEFTGRCIEGGCHEMSQPGTLHGKPVMVYYILTDEDIANEDMANVDFSARVSRIEEVEED